MFYGRRTIFGAYWTLLSIVKAQLVAKVSDSDKMSTADEDKVFMFPSAGGRPVDFTQQRHTPASMPAGAPAMAREVFSLGDGEAVLQWPTTLTPEGVDDLEAWLALVVKKLKRLKGVNAATSAG